jgi:hypothetical protein
MDDLIFITVVAPAGLAGITDRSFGIGPDRKYTNLKWHLVLFLIGGGGWGYSRWR